MPALFKALVLAGMLVGGALNTIILKYQNKTCIAHCSPEDPAPPEFFTQPILQTTGMLVGEIVSFMLSVLYKQFAQGRAEMNTADETTRLLAPRARHKVLLRGTYRLLLGFPAICDTTSTTMLFLILVYIPTSIMNILRGLSIIFAGILAAKFLGRRLTFVQCISLALVFVGIFFSTLPDLLDNSRVEGSAYDARSLIIGVTLVLVSQLLSAFQYISEDIILERFSVAPVEVAGHEGFFGISAILLALLPLYLTSQPTGFFDIVEAARQVISHQRLWVSMLCFLMTQATASVCALLVIGFWGATARATIDQCRTLVVWAISMGLGWESFSAVQAAGFAAVVYGNFAYAGSVSLPFVRS
ncbi:hypothetical protein EC988_001411 [Linderina pennispora]|nr:hypothetical protein EC988_001411 [Linderina pennispora]